MPESVFLQMDAAKKAALARGLSLIDLSIGASDLPPPQVALQALSDAVWDPSTYGYCLRSGFTPLLEAVADWHQQRFGQKLDPARELLPLIGSQEGFSNLLLATTNPGDLILLPDPGYPSYLGAVAIAGLQTHLVPLQEDQNFLPDLQAIPADVAARASVLVLSYPNNPTSGVATPEFMQQAVDFCLQHDILLIHDFPYVDMVFGDYEAPSVLDAKGAMGCAVELYSISKSFHLGGFRLGWAAGNKDAIAALEQLKSAVDFNQYVGIQRAGIAALGLPRSHTRQDARRLMERRDALCQALRGTGWDISVPQASMYVWARIPAPISSFDFALDLARETGVTVAPGRAFGTRGEGFVRFALVREPAMLQEAAQKIAGFLKERV
ncbi:succinyldiaminopimelate aminotransferase [Deinococcus roseus]|uniref:Succinyldiaminopimelate aminotransferase n=2 Tax=Deinococcus roseus TaxID=392414 RepID=A0ABQ2DCC9_9DEIO|nr:succinyldiaminopimelate aminotransferase [Deinococcus roseus]